MRRTTVLIATALSVMSLLTGCDSDDDPVGATIGASPTGVTDPFPAGRYEANGNVEVPTFVTFNGGGDLTVGYRLDDGSTEGRGGSYAVEGNEVTISVRLCDSHDSGRHRYTWTWDGTVLKMTPVGHEGCVSRQVTLAEMTLVKPFEQLVDDFPFGAYESADQEPGRSGRMWADVAFYGDGSLMVGSWGNGSGGSYEVDGNTIEISTAACAQKEETASYEWSLDGSELTMTPLGKDDCVARRTAMAQMTRVQSFPPDQRPPSW